MKLYPLKLIPVLKNAIWGGHRIYDTFSIGHSAEQSAEAWMLTLRTDGVNTIENGEGKGMTLAEYAEKVGLQTLCGTNDFPLLIKIIDANDRLSVQVHPDDTYAKEHGLDAGKTEMWYVLEAEPGATLVSGLKEGISAEDMRKAVANGTCEALLNAIPVKKGDCFYIPAGLVHAIGKGILIAEIQQNSNTTYRLYDYDRVGADGKKRELHIEEAVEVIKTSFDLTDITVGQTVSDSEGSTVKILCRSPFFEAQSVVLSGGHIHTTDARMTHVLCVRGEGAICCEGVSYPLHKGDTYLLPATLSGCTLETETEMECILSSAN